MKTYFVLIIVSYFLSFSMSFAQNNTLPHGTWIAFIQGRVKEIPFLLEVKKNATNTLQIEIINGKERLLLDKIEQSGDQFTIPLHIFDAKIVATFDPKNQTLEGKFIKLYTKQPYELPFKAVFGKKDRFPTSQKPVATISGKFEVEFINANGNSKAVGIFEQKGSYLEGTFLTPTGDYRFLEGVVEGDTMRLSCFDGEHLYLFEAKIDKEGENLEGIFYSGRGQGVKWIGKRNEKAELPNAYALSELQGQTEKIVLSFPAIKGGGTLSTENPKYQGKPLIIQLFGTWCPNCMDETQFLAKWHKENANRGIELIGLAFENKNDLDYAKNRVNKVIERFGVGYDFGFGGDISEENRRNALPFLKRIAAFPTTIFVDRNGKIYKVHTGYSGPATGKFYEDFVKEFEAIVAELLK